MIYFDNAATTWPKPPEVLDAMHHCLENIGANPGRSGHKMSLAAGKLVDDTRQSIAELFNIKESERVIFTLNATDALNMAIKGSLRVGDHVVISSMEHNSVVRPLYGMWGKISVTKVRCAHDGTLDPDAVKRAINYNTRAIILTHASNVTGTVMPIREIGEMARQAGIIFIVDAAQTAGLLDIDVAKMNIDLLAVPGHKGLMGPPGTGILYVGDRVKLKPWREGGTGLHSLGAQPDYLPEKYESGTLNFVGIAGLAAGVNYIRNTGISKILEHELMLINRFLQGAMEIPGIKIFGSPNTANRVPVVSFQLQDKDSIAVAGALDQWYNIACRAGLHCAPDAHRTLGTLNSMLVRFSFSYFNKLEEVDIALQCLDDLKERNIDQFSGYGCNSE
ncbi:putative cysteine desulfurase [Sporotomaculum syntrophicum]|uniref:cysteine desulfurase n=1 Tax=Sporotomaculum syntrophicum TaxID=182264 RepID=A0A9D2WP91_9FIRM|nr:aminotransferase class V-fold PLP-dependent enzyme [Sporotomaculum syntrophicum]KAF1084620.1 putative cysteine desulfurase [Sporotomaculum syntrophicum]